MEQFSTQEKDIIKKMSTPQWLRDLAPFAPHTQLIFSINDDSREGVHKVSYKSDAMANATKEEKEIARQLAIDQCVDLFGLLETLMNDKLVRAYPPAYTSMRQFEAHRQISLGTPQTTAATNFLLEDNAQYLATFLKDYENFRFKATDKLIEFARKDFKTPEDIRHKDQMNQAEWSNRQAVHQAKRANRITIILALVTSLIGVGSVVVQAIYSNRTLQQNEKLIDITKNGNVKDSVMIQLLENKIDFYDELSTKRADQTNTKIDSLKTQINSVQKDTQKIKKKLKMQ